MTKEGILDLEVASNPEWENKETSFYQLGREIKFYSAHRTGIKWAVQRVKDGHAELEDYTVRKDKLVSITVITSPDVISFKSRPRGTKSPSSMYSIIDNFDK